MNQPNVALNPDKTSCVKIDLNSILLRRSNQHHHGHQQLQYQWNEQLQTKKNDSVKDTCIAPTSYPRQKHRIDSTTNDEATVFTSKSSSDPILLPMCAPPIPLRNHVSTLEIQAIHHSSIPPTQPQRCQSITVDLVADGSNLSNGYCYDKILSSPPIQPQRYQSIDATGTSCIDHNDNEENDIIYGAKAPPLPLPNRFAHLSLPPSQPQRIQSIDLNEKRKQPIQHHQYQIQQHFMLSLVVEESMEFSMTWMNASIGASGIETNEQRHQKKECEERKRMFISDSALSGMALKSLNGQPKCWSTAMIDCNFDDDNFSIVSDFTDDDSFDHNDDEDENSCEAKEKMNEVYNKRMVIHENKNENFLSFPSHNGLNTSPSRMSLASIVPRRRSVRKLYDDTLEK